MIKRVVTYRFVSLFVILTNKVQLINKHLVFSIKPIWLEFLLDIIPDSPPAAAY